MFDWMVLKKGIIQKEIINKGKAIRPEKKGGRG